jgi:hypothetical protein
MSVSYYGVPKRDTTIIGPTVEGSLPNAATIDVAVLRSAIERCGLAGKARTLEWAGEDGYIIVNVLSTHVEITHGTGGGDEQINRLVDVVDTLKVHGLHVWDPQKGSWFVG